MNRALVVLAPLALALCLGACTLLVSTSNLAGVAETTDGSSDAAASDAAIGAEGGLAVVGASCRAIHERFPDAGSGSYQLAGDGGAPVPVHCDMETYDGGWTLVTPSMIVEDKSSEAYAPGSPGRVTVTHGIDGNGGVTFALNITKVNCGAASGLAGPGHYFLAGDLDGWTQMMATYEFANSVSCWHIFGDADAQDTNVLPFAPTIDLIGPQENMSRTLAGAAIPFDGRTYRCSEDADNFWAGPYGNQHKSARVVLRRRGQGKPAGIALEADCGMAAWTISDLYVR